VISRDDNGQLAARQLAARQRRKENGLLGFRVIALAARCEKLEQELANLRAENAHLKNALALADALRNAERNLPL
jgi:hypothetical protein